MIFVTTGTQAPFNRLVRVMDQIAAELPDQKVIVQAFGVDFETPNLTVVGFLNPIEYNKIFDEATLVVSHAGMGSVLSALAKGKRIIIIPRRAQMGEHRDDHQLDSAKKMELLGYVPVAYDEGELKGKIMEILRKEPESGEAVIGEYASKELVKSIRDFILND
jgi:UDP-N-acetylglucosamine transferase subunit ALG13